MGIILTVIFPLIGIPYLLIKGYVNREAYPQAWRVAYIVSVVMFIATVFPFILLMLALTGMGGGW